MFRIKQKWYGGVDISAAKQKHIKDQQKERDTHRRIPRAIHRDRISMETQKKNKSKSLRTETQCAKRICIKSHKLKTICDDSKQTIWKMRKKVI